MFCANLQRLDFVVWFGDGEQFFVETILYDEEFVLRFLLPRPNYFFCRAVLPEFFTKRVKNGLKLYLHDGWENFSKKLYMHNNSLNIYSFKNNYHISIATKYITFMTPFSTYDYKYRCKNETT